LFSISVSGDGQLLAGKGNDDLVRVWRCDQWTQVAELPETSAHQFTPSVAFHPTEPVLATLGEKDTVIRIWDLDFDELLKGKGRARNTVGLHIGGLPEMSEATERGVRFAARFAEGAGQPIDSTLLLAGYLNVRRATDHRDTTHFLSEYLMKQRTPSPKNASPVTLLGLKERYGITRVPDQGGKMPEVGQFNEDGVRALELASEAAEFVSRRKRVGARHVIGGFLRPPKKGASPPRAQLVLVENNYDLDELRQAFLDAMRGFSLPDDDQGRWKEFLGLDGGPPPPRSPEEFVLETKGVADTPTTDDQLRYGAYATAIAKIIKKDTTETPLSVAIQAPWGQGKSSLMRMIQVELETGAVSGGTNISKRAANAPGFGSWIFRWVLEDIKNAARAFGARIAVGNPFERNLRGGRLTYRRFRRWLRESEDAISDNILGCRQGDVRCVWFNPLLYQSAEQVWEGLTHAILVDMAKALPPQISRDEYWLRLRLARLDRDALRWRIHTYRRTEFWPNAARWAAGAVAFLTLYAFSGASLVEGLTGENAVALIGTYGTCIAALGGLAHFAARSFVQSQTLAEEFRECVGEPGSPSSVGGLRHITDDVERSVKLLVGEKARVVIFVDDLDRCPSKTVRDVIVAINRFTSVQRSNVVFVLGVDMEMVANSLDASLEGPSEDEKEGSRHGKSVGWRFMEKFVHLSFLVPRIDEHDQEAFLRDRLMPVTDDTEGRAQAEESKRVCEESIEEADEATTPRAVSAIATKAKSVSMAPDDKKRLDKALISKAIELLADRRSEEAKALIDLAVKERLVQQNPRSMNRFLNLARLMCAVQVSRGAPSDGEYARKVVARCAHLVLEWPRAASWLQRGEGNRGLEGAYIKDPGERLLGFATKVTTSADWAREIRNTWGQESEAALARPDLYDFIRRTADDPPTFVDLYNARLF
jgi:hypothetical protein